ncbi:MAG: hypothetical protein RIC35_07795 [Marinoscillum sp.]
MKQFNVLLFGVFCTLAACKKESPEDPVESLMTCSEPSDTVIVADRSFKMGFSTWPYATGIEAKEGTYAFIDQNADIYSEQFDDHIPWMAIMDNRPMAEPMARDLNERVQLKLSKDLVVSVSLFNPERNDLITGYMGNTPTYSKLNDQQIEDTYYYYLNAVLDSLAPEYLVMAMEVNEFYLNKPEQWEDYKLLATNIKERLKIDYPELLISESVTLHNLVDADDNEYLTEIIDYVNTMDFAAISYYPFIHGALNQSAFERDLAFLKEHITKPIALVETAHIAEDLELENPPLLLEGDECTQKDYMQAMLRAADESDFEFVIWWSHKDFDALWNTFPDDVKPLGKLWRDTGLINEKDQERPALQLWQAVFMD